MNNEHDSYVNSPCLRDSSVLLNKAQWRLISLNQGKLIEAGGFSICLLSEGQESRGSRH
jgi:hypothetical protein